MVVRTPFLYSANFDSIPLILVYLKLSFTTISEMLGSSCFLFSLANFTRAASMMFVIYYGEVLFIIVWASTVISPNI